MLCALKKNTLSVRLFWQYFKNYRNNYLKYSVWVKIKQN